MSDIRCSVIHNTKKSLNNLNWHDYKRVLLIISKQILIMSNDISLNIQMRKNIIIALMFRGVENVAGG